jgi:hypothetical protein
MIDESGQFILRQLDVSYRISIIGSRFFWLFPTVVDCEQLAPRKGRRGAWFIQLMSMAKEINRVRVEDYVYRQLIAERRTIKWLCKELSWPRTKWYRFQESGLIEVGDLHRISHLLNHNFFHYYSDIIPSEEVSL